MRRLVFLILMCVGIFVEIPFAMTFISEAQLANMNNSLTIVNQSDCVILMGTNFNMVQFCSAPDKTINANINLAYGQTYTNVQENFSATAPPFPIISQTISAGQTYTNGSIQILCQPQFANSNATLIGGQSGVYGSVFVTCRDLPRNVNRVLGFGENYQDSALNINVTAPQFYSMNANRNLNFGETVSSSQFDSRLNFSFTCANTAYDICKRNISTTLDLGQSFYDATCNIAVKAPSKTSIGINKSLDYGETYVRDDWGIQVTAPKRPDACQLGNAQIYLDENHTSYTNPPLNISVECRQRPAQQFSAAALGVPPAFCNATISISGTNLTYCPSRLTDLCTNDEKIKADFEGCINRIANVTVTQKDEVTTQKIKCDYDLQQCRGGQQATNDTQEGFVKVVSIFIFITVGGLALFEYLRRKKTDEQG